MKTISIYEWIYVAAAALGLAACGASISNDDDEVSSQGVTVSGVTAITGSYWGNADAGAACIVSHGLVGYQPADSGTYPVFVYAVGFGGNYDSAEGDSITKAMASKGYVALSLDYDNLGGIYNNATGVAAALGSARCAFRDDGTAHAAWSSAIDKICYSGAYKASCAKGIVVAGMSEGSIVALSAANTNRNVRAAWIMGNAGELENAGELGDPTVCNGSSGGVCAGVTSTRALPSSRLRVVTSSINGSSIDSPNPDPTDCDMYRLTGIGQPDPSLCVQPALGAQDGIQPDGHGWYLVQPSEVTVTTTACSSNSQCGTMKCLASNVCGNPDSHCFYQTNSCVNQPVSQPTFEPNWYLGSPLPWGLDASLAFLDGFVTH